MKFNIADSVIQILSETNVDGETMEYIINQLGMREQMLRQLVVAPMEMMNAKVSADAIRGGEGPEYDSAGFHISDREEDPEYDGDWEDAPVVALFTKKDLIEYTRQIQTRALAAVKEAIKGSGVDMESYVELDLFSNTIEVEVDDDSIYSEIVSNVEDVFETDDDSVWDEATNVIQFMK